MSPYDAEAWHDFFVMTGGAAAALAGLIFVAVSLNHEEILAGDRLPNLAARTVSVLIGLLLFSMFALAPQSVTALGVEVLALGVVLVVLTLLTSLRGGETGDPRAWRVANVGLSLVASVPALAAGASLLAGRGGGLYWLLAELVAGTMVAAYNGWVLLIEIRR